MNGRCRFLLAALMLAAAGLGCSPSRETPPPQPQPGAGVTPPAPTFDVGIYVVYLTQATQDYAGNVPLVQGRDGLLRAFLISRYAGVPAPAVRVKIVDTASGTAVQTYTPAAPSATIPTSYDEAALAGSWNVSVPGAALLPGRHVLVEADPVGGLPAGATQQTSFRYPAAGSLDVRAVSTVPVTIIPVVQVPSTGPALIPDVSDTRTLDSWLDRARRIHPVHDISVAVGSTYSTQTLVSVDGPGWSGLLGELRTKQVADGATSRYYVGALHTTYTSGVAGIGYVPGQTVLSWDVGIGLSYQKVTAHELGHNFGLLHAPCAPTGTTLGSVDPTWPTGATYASAHIGVFGWDPLTPSVLKSPSSFWDHMGYCGSASTTWTSDYNYRAAMSTLTGRVAAIASSLAAREPVLLVSGRIAGERVEVDSAFELDAVPSAPEPGEHALELLSGGEVLATLPFDPVPLALERSNQPPEAHFALAVPVPASLLARVDGLRVMRGGGELFRRTSPRLVVGTPPTPSSRLVSAAAFSGRTYVGWDAVRFPRAMVRDAETGEVIALLRGGDAMLHGSTRALEVLLTDGVRSERRLVEAR